MNRPIPKQMWRFWSASLTIMAVAGGSVSFSESIQAEEKPIIIRAVEGLRFDPPRISVEPGGEIHLRFENADTTTQLHNLVVVRPGTRQSVIDAALALGADAPARGYVPTGSNVIAGTRLLTAGETEALRFKMPEEAGIYGIVCTFPGHGMVMFGAMYAGVEMPKTPESDPHIPHLPAPPPLTADPRPMVRRIFLPDASPAAIAVALPGGFNLCWDAGPCRVRYGWSGEFLDAEKHFRGKGQALAQLGGPVAWRAPNSFPIRFEGRPPGTVAFRGYRLEEGIPVFMYVADDKEITEKFSVKHGNLVRQFRLPGGHHSIEIDGSLPPLDPPTTTGGRLNEGVLKVSFREAEDISLVYRLPSESSRKAP